MSAVCIVRPKTIFAIYTNDERPHKTIRTGYDMEKSMSRLGLVFLSYCLIYKENYILQFIVLHCNFNSFIHYLLVR